MQTITSEPKITAPSDSRNSRSCSSWVIRSPSSALRSLLFMPLVYTSNRGWQAYTTEIEELSSSS